MNKKVFIVSIKNDKIFMKQTLYYDAPPSASDIKTDLSQICDSMKDIMPGTYRRIEANILNVLPDEIYYYSQDLGVIPAQYKWGDTEMTITSQTLFEGTKLR